jgi:anhydro-N-acetylmuramic acid kinase
MDGLDMALCKIAGAGKEMQLALVAQTTWPYDEVVKGAIQKVFSKEQVSLSYLTGLHPWLALQHANMIKETLKKCDVDAQYIDLIASHGQTIFHAPKKLINDSLFGNATLQIVEADHLAVHTGIITISDFRQKHIAFGGEGAPLAIYGDYLLAKNETENRVLLNIGGIANYTYLPAGASMEQIHSTDTGPGNTLMDQWVRKHFNKSYDEHGVIAGTGKVNNILLQQLLSHPFFSWVTPKTIGPELFNLSFIEEAISKTNIEIAPADVLATLNELTAITITDSIRRFIPNDTQYAIYVSGGGLHNGLLMDAIKRKVPKVRVESADTIGIHADAKEAILFAILANEHVAGSAQSLGKVSFPL